jgi:hypothetical protein
MDAQGEFFRHAMLSPEERTEETVLRIEEMMKTMSRRLASVEQRLDAIQGSTARMDTHIHFITRAYDYFKAPLTRLVNLTSRVTTIAPAPGFEIEDVVLDREKDGPVAL